MRGDARVDNPQIGDPASPIIPSFRDVLTRTVLISALGYFVDIYDLLVFLIVRRPSLVALGLEGDALRTTGELLLNVQMIGLLVGGLLWGILGDKRGRVTVLFGSIFLYSTATFANAFIHSLPAYAALRFIAGVGLAGELGAAITLVSELMSREARGYGTSLVAAIGILGAVVASLVSKGLDWRAAYIVGGLLGFVLLGARFALRESGMFNTLRQSSAPRGDLRLLFGSRASAAKYAWSVLVGLPIWFVIGILFGLSPELGSALAVRGSVDAGLAILFGYAGASVGDLASGFLSQTLRSRKTILLAFLTGTSVFIFAYVFSHGISLGGFYALCTALGFFAGYWAVFVTNAAEQFGTNLRATVATTVPNVIRGSVVPVTLLFEALARPLGLVRSALLVGQFCVLVALFSLRNLPETYGKDLDYVETGAPAAVGA